VAILEVYVDDETLRRLKRAAKRLDRSIENLAEAAVSEAALEDAKANNELRGMRNYVPPP
jgi:predicted transcriptional regulator